MTYYGFKIIFHFTFACGCTRRRGPIFERFAYMYAGLGEPQWCGRHNSAEVSREVERVDGPHGYISMGWWRLEDGSKVFLAWSPQTRRVWVADFIGSELPAEWGGEEIVQLPDLRTVYAVVGDDHLGGDRPESAGEILARLREAAVSKYPARAAPM